MGGSVPSGSLFSWEETHEQKAVLTAEQADYYIEELRLRSANSTEEHNISEYTWSMQEELVAPRYARQETHVLALLQRALKVATLGALSASTLWRIFSEVVRNRNECRNSL